MDVLQTIVCNRCGSRLRVVSISVSEPGTLEPWMQYSVQPCWVCIRADIADDTRALNEATGHAHGDPA